MSRFQAAVHSRGWSTPTGGMTYHRVNLQALLWTRAARQTCGGSWPRMEHLGDQPPVKKW